MSFETIYTATREESRIKSFVNYKVAHFDGANFNEYNDPVIQEIVLRVFVNGALHHEGTCSPWDIKELIIGGMFLSGELHTTGQIDSFSYEEKSGVVKIETHPEKMHSTPFASRSAHKETVILKGVFSGTENTHCCTQIFNTCKIDAAYIHKCITRFEKCSFLFHRTGGVHNAVLFDSNGIIAWFEDVGRHNVIDKLAGWCFLNGINTSDKILLFSGRIPQEIIEKVIRLGCPYIVSPGAPTSLSVELAQRRGITLIGFAKNNSFNIYTHAERIIKKSDISL